MLVLEIDGLELRCLDDGLLPPWIGTMLRGLWTRALPDPLYRQLCRPETPPDAAGDDSATAPREVVASSMYPTPTRVRRGNCLPLHIVLAGAAVPFAEPVLDAIDAGGRERGLKLGSQTTRVDLGNRDRCTRQLFRLEVDGLPSSAEAITGNVPRVRVELTSPLRLKPDFRHKEDERRRHVARPTMTDLVAASVRTVTRLLKLSGEDSEVDHSSLKRAADAVVCCADRFVPFEQLVSAYDGSQKYRFVAVTGTATFVDVPLALLPWLQWGGLLHVGDRRPAGAGGWRLILD